MIGRPILRASIGKINLLLNTHPRVALPMSDVRLFFSSCQGAQVAQNRQSSLIHTFIQFLQFTRKKFIQFITHDTLHGTPKFRDGEAIYRFAQGSHFVSTR